MMSKLYGWYSAKEVEHWVRLSDNYLTTVDRSIRLRPAVYTTPSGSEVTATEITSTPEMKVDMFGDFVFLGEVVKFVRSIDL